MTLLELAKVHFLGADLIAAIGVAVTLTAAIVCCDSSALGSIGVSTRHEMYLAAAAVTATLVGFALVAVTILLDLSRQPGLAYLRRSPFFGQIHQSFLSTVWVLSGATAAYFLATILDSGESMNWMVLLIVLLAVFLTIVRLGRCLQILSLITAQALRDPYVD